MRFIAGLLISMAAFSTDAQDPRNHDPRDAEIYGASDLVPWCRSEVEARYVAKGITPYQWTSRYYDRSGVLYVEARLRVHGDDVAVRCRLAQGARVMYMTVEIDDPSL